MPTSEKRLRKPVAATLIWPLLNLSFSMYRAVMIHEYSNSKEILNEFLKMTIALLSESGIKAD